MASINNRQINHEYNVIDKVECGIELKGTEVKSIREGKANLKDSFAMIRGGEVMLKNMHISPYDHGNIFNVNEMRDRKLLLNKNEILKILGKIKQGGYTLIPSKLYFKGKWAKIELCLCTGKKLYDKRDDMKKRDAEKRMNEYKKY